MIVNNKRLSLIKELREYWIKNNIPNVSDTNALFLSNLIHISRANLVLEIWTANWFSTIHLADSVEKNNWKVISIDFSEPSLKMAKENILNAWLEKSVDLLFGNALDIIPTLDEQFDFVFIDWMMKSSIDFLLTVWNKTIDWWIIIIDDVIKFKEKMWGLEDFLNKNNIQFNILPIDIDDWIMMIIKQNTPLIK